LYCCTGGPFTELEPQTPELFDTDTSLLRNGWFTAEETTEFAIKVDELLSDLYSFTTICEEQMGFSRRNGKLVL
jgi:hypothetical protein